jgi:hypothetical protein
MSHPDIQSINFHCTHGCPYRSRNPGRRTNRSLHTATEQLQLVVVSRANSEISVYTESTPYSTARSVDFTKSLPFQRPLMTHSNPHLPRHPVYRYYSMNYRGSIIAQFETPTAFLLSFAFLPVLTDFLPHLKCRELCMRFQGMDFF